MNHTKKVVMLLLIVNFSSSWSQGTPSFHRDSGLNQLLIGAVAYTSVAGACGLSEQYFNLKSMLVRLLERERGLNSLTQQGLILYSNLESYLEAGEQEYEGRPYVTCGNASEYIDKLIELISDLQD